MSLYNNYIFPFTEQTSESPLPILLDVIFGMIFPFQSALSILKNFLSVLFSVIIYPNTDKCWLTWLLVLLIFNLIQFNLYIGFIHVCVCVCVLCVLFFCVHLIN